MKTPQSRWLRFCAAVSLLAATTASAQTVRVWDGGNGTGVGLEFATNWVGDTLPAVGSGDLATWDGTVPGNLVLTYNTGLGGFAGNPGIQYVLTATQTGSVSIVSSVANSGLLAVGRFITNNSPSGSLQFGNNSSSNLSLVWRNPEAFVAPSFQPRYFINNSPAPSMIYPNVRTVAGGGNPHTLVFGGTGDWIVNNYLRTDNGVGTFVRKQDSGTLFWGGPTTAPFNSVINSPVVIEAGRLVLTHPNVLGTQTITNNGTRLEYDTGAGATTLTGPIHGTGNLRVTSGTLTLGTGTSTYSGNTELVGGTLVLGGGELNPGVNGALGVGGTISFTGGTLQFSAVNTYDYSPRFSTAAGQAYRLNTGGQSVTLATGLGGSGNTLVKSGSGTLTLNGVATYDGLTTVSAGRLVFVGGKTGTGNITVGDGAALGVTDTGTPVAPTTLTLGTSTGVTLEFNNITSTTTAPLAAGGITAAGPVTINVNSGSFTVGQSYPLFSWTSGSAPAVILGTVTGASGNLTTNGNTIKLNITSLAYLWTGGTDGNWDTTTAGNWTAGGGPALFANGNSALFDDTAPGATSVTVAEPVAPLSVTVNASSKTYNISSSGANNIGGSGGLTKSGTSTLTLAGGANTYTGPTIINAGTVSVGALANGGSPSDIGASSSAAGSLVLNGGGLLYNGGAASIDRLFTLGTGGGTLNASGSGALVLNNAGALGLSGTGARVLTLTGSSLDDNLLAASIGDSGGATALAKSGGGKWVLTGNNTYSGGTTISGGGTLQVGNGGVGGSLGSGNVTVGGSSLVFNRTGTVTNGVISGTGSVTVQGGGTVVLPGNNTYTGGTTVNGSTLQVGVGGATGSLNNGSGIVNNGTLVFDSTSDFPQSGVISGTGNLVKRGSGLLKLIGANTFNGWTLIESGATLQICEGNQGAYASSVITNQGTLLMTRQDMGVFVLNSSVVGPGRIWKDNNNMNVGFVTLAATNTHTGGTFIAGGGVIVGNGGTDGWISGDVVFTNTPTAFDNARFLYFDRGDDVTFPGLVTFSPTLNFGVRGVLVHRGAGTLTLTANNDYPGGTVISNGVLRVGNGGPTGAIGTGPVENNGTLVWDRSTDLTFNAVISGSGSVVKTGAGLLRLGATNTYFGSMTVSNGTLLVNGQDFAAAYDIYGGTLGGTGTVYSPVTLQSGTALAPGDNGVGTLTFFGALDIGGNMIVEINKSLAQSNDFVNASSTLQKTGSGTLTVVNLGPALSAGDKFTLFSQPVTGGAGFTVTGAGATWQNDLATDGSITALTVAPPAGPTNITYTLTGNQLTLNWPASHTGWILQAQTNSRAIGITTNWVDVAGSGATNQAVLTVNPAEPTVFFRLRSP